MKPTVVYMCVMRTDKERDAIRIHSGPTLDETLHSVKTLRRFHPDINVALYTDINGIYNHKPIVEAKFDIFPIGVERNEIHYKHENFWERNKWWIPDLRILIAKIDCLLLHPGPILFLDSDTQIHAPLDEIFESDESYLHTREYKFVDSTFSSVVHNVRWQNYGIDPNIVANFSMFNSGVIWLPQAKKQIIWQVKQWLIDQQKTIIGSSGSDRLKEQVALSIFLQANGEVRQAKHLISHYWWRRYKEGIDALGDNAWRWYKKIYSKLGEEI